MLIADGRGIGDLLNRWDAFGAPAFGAARASCQAPPAGIVTRDGSDAVAAPGDDESGRPGGRIERMHFVQTVRDGYHDGIREDESVEMLQRDRVDRRHAEVKQKARFWLLLLGVGCGLKRNRFSRPCDVCCGLRAAPSCPARRTLSKRPRIST